MLVLNLLAPFIEAGDKGLLFPSISPWASMPSILTGCLWRPHWPFCPEGFQTSFSLVTSIGQA